jgi:hypothetical protein
MALTLGQRKALFLTGCMGTRVLLVVLAATLPLRWLRVLGVLGGAVAAWFTVIYAGKLRPSGAETGGQPIWWNSLRPVHAMLYAAFAYCAWVGNRRGAWTALLVDVIIGFAAFVHQHYL